MNKLLRLKNPIPVQRKARNTDLASSRISRDNRSFIFSRSSKTKSKGVQRQLIGYTYQSKPYVFNEYYNQLLSSNELNNQLFFAKNPWSSSSFCILDSSTDIDLGAGGGYDLIFFIDPEKNQDLVNQAKRLKIPTIGIISSGKGIRKRMPFKGYSLEDAVHYPIIGNPASYFFVQALLDVFVNSFSKTTSLTLQCIPRTD